VVGSGCFPVGVGVSPCTEPCVPFPVMRSTAAAQPPCSNATTSRPSPSPPPLTLTDLRTWMCSGSTPRSLMTTSQESRRWTRSGRQQSTLGGFLQPGRPSFASYGAGALSPSLGARHAVWPRPPIPDALTRFVKDLYVASGLRDTDVVVVPEPTDTVTYNPATVQPLGVEPPWNTCVPSSHPFPSHHHQHHHPCHLPPPPHPAETAGFECWSSTHV
jgi:hypothetical protein